MNTRAGMDPLLVEVPSAPVESFLKVSADQLAHILSLFQTLDLIQPEGPNRLSLKDLGSLRKMADASIEQASVHTSEERSRARPRVKAQANG